MKSFEAQCKKLSDWTYKSFKEVLTKCVSNQKDFRNIVENIQVNF